MYQAPPLTRYSLNQKTIKKKNLHKQSQFTSNLYTFNKLFFKFSVMLFIVFSIILKKSYKNKIENTCIN